MSGIITGPHFINYFGTPGPIEIGTMVSVLEIGAFVTSVAAGRVGDIIGRKGTLFLGSVVFTIGGTIQTFSAGFTSMVIGRIVSGFGVGLLSWLIDSDKDEEGLRVLADLHGGDLNHPAAKAEFREIKEKVIFEMTLALGSTGLWIFLDLPNTPKAVVVSVIIYNAAFGYSFMLVYFFYPETKGVPLEDMDAVFGEGSNKMLTERRASFDHEHIPFMSNTQRTLDTYPPKPSPSTVRSAPRRLLGRFFRPRSPYHPVENDENEELMALNGEVIDVHVDKPQETSHVDWTRD
ncbi:hypothetical protein C0989_009046 [Termitomyces sp. Mn162]|nr:hypothetical protein C0989_009046 [Termitomyces sp. Mn162]